MSKTKSLRVAAKQFLRNFGLELTEENITKITNVVEPKEENPSSSDELQQQDEDVEVEAPMLKKLIEEPKVELDKGYLLNYNKLTKSFNIVTITYNLQAQYANITEVKSLGDFEPRALRDYNIEVTKNLFKQRGR